MTVKDVLGKDYTGEVYEGDLDLSGRGLTSLKGSPKIVNGDFNCKNNMLTSLKYSPVEVVGSFFCSNNKISSLEFSPKKVGVSFFCDNNNLINLKGSPVKIFFIFNCSNNLLETLEGGPIYVRGSYDCSYNNIASLECAPKNIGWSFICTNCPNLIDIDFEFKSVINNILMYNNESLTLNQKVNFLFKNSNNVGGDILFYEEKETRTINILLKKIDKFIKYKEINYYNIIRSIFKN